MENWFYSLAVLMLVLWIVAFFGVVYIAAIHFLLLIAAISFVYGLFLKRKSH